MLTKSGEKNQKKKAYILHNVSRISLLIPLFLLCISFSVPAQAKNTYIGNTHTNQLMLTFSNKKGSMIIGKKYSISDFITFQGKKPTIKKIKSSNMPCSCNFFHRHIKPVLLLLTLRLFVLFSF